MWTGECEEPKKAVELHENPLKTEVIFFFRNNHHIPHHLKYSDDGEDFMQLHIRQIFTKKCFGHSDSNSNIF